MKIHLSQNSIKELVAENRSKRLVVSDAAAKGLSLELRPKGGGSWRYRYTSNSKQECLTLGLLSELSLESARSLASRMSSKISEGQNPACDARNEKDKFCPTFSAFIRDSYLPHIRSYKKCVTADITLLNNHLIPEFGGLRMNDISRAHIQKFQTEKVMAGYKPAYCNRFLVLLSYSFNLAIRWETTGVVKNPVKLVPLLKANNKIERFLTKDETSRLIFAIEQSPNPMLKYFVLFALLTGMRKREILDAKWQDVDLDRKLWLIPSSKSGYLRHVPLTDASSAVLKELKNKLPTLIKQNSFLDNPWVIPNCRTGKPFRSIFNSWDSARRKAGLEDVRIHDLRHTYASVLVNLGVPIYDVQKLLGHKDVKTTQRYAHFSMERLRSSSSAVSGFYDFDLAGCDL